MKLLFFVYVFSFVSFAEAQTAKIVARKACEVVEKCSDVDHFTGPDRGLVWGGITIYDWGDHDNNPATLDTLGWSQCAKATVQNSGADSTVTEDNCTCNCPYERNHADCVGEETCTCTLKTCPSGETLNTSTCVCEPTCSLSQSDCTGGQTFNSSTCTCDCDISCSGDTRKDTNTCACVCGLTAIDCINQGKILNTDNCQCEYTCSMPSCVSPYTPDYNSCSCECSLTPSNCNSGQTFDADSCSCNTNPPDCVSDSECGECKQCSGGQCRNKPNTFWAPSLSQYCTTERVTQSRCRRGVKKTRSKQGTKTTGECSTPECSSDTQCGSKCKRCTGGKCKPKPDGSIVRNWYGWTPSLHCTTETGTQWQDTCENGERLNKQNPRQVDGTKTTGECSTPECSVNSDCGDCQRCHQSTRTCVNKTTGWIPTWTRSQHCPDVSQEQTRCLNGVEKTRTLTGTKTIGCGSTGCQHIPQENKCCSNVDGTPEQRDCREGTGTQTRTKTKICNRSSIPPRQGVLDTNWTYGDWDTRDCICTPEDCTPVNKKCDPPQTGTQRGVRYSGKYKCKDGLVDRTICTGGRWDDSDCRNPCTPLSEPASRDCLEGTGTETTTRTKGCINGRLDRNWTYGEWDTSNCIISPPPCTEEICTPEKTCGVVLIQGQANSGRRECVDGVLSEECTGGNNLNGAAWIPECPTIDVPGEECDCPQDRCWTVSENNDMCLWEGGIGCGPQPTIPRIPCQPR